MTKRVHCIEEKGVGDMEDAGLNLVRGGEGWAVEEREGRGRCLVATRQLEVIN